MFVFLRLVFCLQRIARILLGLTKMSTVRTFEESTCDAPVHILNEVAQIEAEMVSNRRWFHAHPELGFAEFKTAAKVTEILKSYGISKIWEGVGRTGVVALIEGGSSGPCIGLRADMDGLPITETAKIDYISTHPGAMHACGHDGHISALLGAAKILHEQRSSMKGTIKLLFQPAEEGGGGARYMIEDGVLEEGKFGPRVDFVYGIHLWSGMLFTYRYRFFAKLSSLAIGKNWMQARADYGRLRLFYDRCKGKRWTRSDATLYS